ncbi:similar to Saccharomyces cerevisiae YOL076W MDM20 Non-catalytic subunit of the NatB N-terminal acetyltransferase, which catalyzes N-acetylation of proteins with specific N-terminal sequences [Maudiozyma barnettii]|uniref:Similar to Saccharomyces cerevisiae YOL076W MDM20 Non-catalytic subunit of the NatB N-terminal acetyltransferase, which catalyzes N-acetylation of proteins with specific N-terminal sequences n=1 Tax=Maudiozyma barnettii TaxID=61262 RepID=A0A8H2VE45_9SACH|nr:Mdm20p [Kazachstania barnettii]CAB4253215.1 similar to Saccharomyces cerevisiae YOL076W MDM20 Non-catalytic subunit of the NatB N-terminal acetyltransferase, which catalyzes N-acetylation of proteins with specific N-terminal sequences [Kazachstania barnettii]CAD1780249.1 similar to Saccharomyces cerevisiae YOL076W MDM20 Non-catalytic subunit of the NatB N-terminal acetyltransferase, which catalyzes N-acetylation of proteins with specific N-terminal sequences [Kazachstania barnettii]
MSVWEKLEDQSNELIAKSNFKQCYQTIDQYKARYPKSIYLQILESYVRYKQSPSKFNFETSLLAAYGEKGTSYTIDQDALNLLHKFFFELEKYEDALHVFEKSNAKQPGFEISYLWFDRALQDCNFKHLGKASLQLSKFPKDSVHQPREYYFWNAITTVALFKFQNYRLSSQEKCILPLLTYKNLCNVKPFKNNEEIIVFCTVCETLFPDDVEKSQEICKEILPYFDDSVDLYLKNFFLKHVEKNNHTLIFDTCSKILKSLDDYELMKRIVTSGKALGKSQQDLYDLIDGLVSTKSRNGRLIRFEIDLMYDKIISEQSLKYYLERFHNRPCCVTDIIHYRNKISNAELISEVFDSFKELNDEIHDSNIVKLGLKMNKQVQYYNKHKAGMKNKPKTDYSLCSTFILDLIKKDILGPSMTLEDSIFVISMLENYQKEDPNNYDTKVWLIAMYMYLGLTPMAYSYYQDLSVKNVQVDSMDYLIYSRFSSLFPHKQHDYLNKTLPEHDALYDNSLSRISQFISISFDRKSYSKILGMFEFQDRLLKSVGRFSKLCDGINMTYICNDKRTALIESLRGILRQIESTGDSQLSDNRDWSIYGLSEELDKTNVPECLSVLSIDNEWIIYNLIKIFMIDAIPTGKQSDMVNKLLGMLTEGSDVSKHMTAAENISFKIINDIYYNNALNLPSLLNDISAENINPTTWRGRQTYLTHISTLKTLDNMKRIKDKEQKTRIKQKLTELRNHCDELFKTYKEQIVSACASLKTGERHDILTSLGYSPLGPENLTASIVEVQKAIRNL